MADESSVTAFRKDDGPVPFAFIARMAMSTDDCGCKPSNNHGEVVAKGLRVTQVVPPSVEN
jgi:hypothetical protein